MKKHTLQVAPHNTYMKASFGKSHVLCSGEVKQLEDGSVIILPGSNKPARVLVWGKWNMTSDESIHLVASCREMNITSHGNSQLEVKKTISPEHRKFTATCDGKIQYHFCGCGCKDNYISMHSEQGNASITFPRYNKITGKSIAYGGVGNQIYVNSAKVIAIP
jgi:hypothetical protein